MRITVVLIALLLEFALAPAAWAHAFPNNSSPHVGAFIDVSPKIVKVWFDGEIEPVFSTLKVENATGKLVSKAKGHVDKTDHTLLEASLPKPLTAGKYSVHWSVIARDGHHTAGQFAFTVR